MKKVNIQKRPIGVFDSGVGGLTVVKALMKALPSEDIVYFGDTARVPYGTKSRQSIIRFSKENASILLRHKVKVIVVACNSSSSYALSALKKNFNVPIVGVIAPGVKKAVEVTRNNRIGVIATPATIKSGAYKSQLKKRKRGVKISSQVCPLFVPLAEEGVVSGLVSQTIAKQYLKEIRNAKVDTLILGCTHYPLLKSTIRTVMGGKVELIDSSDEVAWEVKKLLLSQNTARISKRKGKYRFFVSDDPAHFKKLAKRFIGRSVGNVKRAAL